jgi:predicted RNA-binding Zn ribbon-like protein
MVKRNILQSKDTMAPSPATRAYRFDIATLVPDLCLGFANTLENRLTGPSVEHLNSYGDLVAWARERGILSAQEAEQLAQEAVRRPVEAASTLARAMVLREAIYRTFSAVAAERLPEAGDMMTLNIALAGALAVLHVVATAQGFAWAWSRGGAELGRVLWPVILSTVNLLTSNELPAVRECAAPHSGWLFLDTTRNRSRRWCDMQVCGNRAKARRHYERTKQAAGRQRQEDTRQTRS